MRRAVVAWVVVAVLAAGAAVAAVAALNATAFGAAGFVRVYLEAVSRGDAAGALSMPGVTVDADARADLLVDAALAGPAELREITVAPGPDGTELVTVGWTRGEADAVSTFAVERTGSRLGVFPDWAFAVSPVAVLQLTVEHDERFDLNGVAAAGSDDYAVLVPGVYRVDHHSTYLRAAAVDVVADRPGSELGTTLDVQPAEVFTETLTARLHDDLDECVTQKVLFPTGCPMGHPIANRVASTPTWSMIEYPVGIRIEPGPESGTWLVREADLVAHLTVDVQSLFDGSVTTFDEDIPVTASYLVTIGADDTTLRVEAV